MKPPTPETLYYVQALWRLRRRYLEDLEGIEPEIYENLRGPVHRA